MIFSELYSAYYNTVASIISRLLDGENDEKKLHQIVSEKAFGESALTILPALKGEKWQLMRSDMTTAISRKPTMPLTLLQRRWLKAISLDLRIKLFGVEFEGLDGVEPLFTANDYLIYDRYSDGDPFDDEGYINRFRFILAAIRERAPIKIALSNKDGNSTFTKCIPIRLEYSEKDDKFRLITGGCHFLPVINLSKVTSCSRYNGEYKISTNQRDVQYRTVTMEITDERNALERVMLHFAHFEKRAEKLDGNRYTVKIKYDSNDESEIVIRVLSFGPLVRVTEPSRFVNLIKDRLIRQKNCNLR
ncbi:MAG: hypothetical protein IKA74_05160 [Clostridia bacterium]|nr:hypothetical protein [Clostridia bacterium]